MRLIVTSFHCSVTAGRIDRDPALCFFWIKVGGCGALVNFPQSMGGAGIEQHALGDRRLAGIDMSNHADVAKFVELVSHENRGLSAPKIKGPESGNPNPAASPLDDTQSLPSEVSEGLIGIRHAMDILSTRHCRAFFVVCCDQFGSQRLVSRATLLFSHGHEQPANG